jgi:dipeptidase
MRDHLEGTPLDMSKDFGAQPYHLPYRWRPLVWHCCNKRYFNERVVATQQTGFSFVAQARNWLPDKIGGLFWFSVDDAANSVYVPIYVAIEHPPHSYAHGNGSMEQWSDDAAFWVFNQVSNLAYTRYDSIHPYIHKYQQQLENKFIAYTPAVDKAAMFLYKENPQLAYDFLTDYSVNMANSTVQFWKKLYHFLFMKFKDGNIMKSRGMTILDNGNHKGIPKYPYQPGYSKEWYKTVVEKTGNKFLYPSGNSQQPPAQKPKNPKKQKKNNSH